MTAVYKEFSTQNSKSIDAKAFDENVCENRNALGLEMQ